MIGVVVCFTASVFYGNDPNKMTVPLLDGPKGAVTIELAGDIEQRGIYVMASGTTLTSLLKILGIAVPAGALGPLSDQRLETGQRVFLNRNGQISLGDMAAATRLALDLPIDVNKAAFDDLILIPGVKEITAARILAFRQAAGGRIGRMEDLLAIPGLKEKRLASLKKYLHAPP